jgi:predicted ABC-type ATPase
MSRLILLNGPPGIGKSTLAELWADRHPGTLNLDIDRVRMLVGGWCDDFVGTGEVVRPLVLHMAASHLDGGRDVIVPQYLSATAEVAAFEQVASHGAASFVEVLLLDSRESAVQRFDAEPLAGDALRPIIKQVVEQAGGRGHLEVLYDDLLRTAASRATIEVNSRWDDIEGTYELLRSALRESAANNN